MAYKERGRHRLARSLGEALASAVLAGCPDRPVSQQSVRPQILLVPVPSTAAAARARGGGDHLRPLAAQVGRRLRANGQRCQVLDALVARPRPDSAGLSSAERAANRSGAFAVRRSARAALKQDCVVVIVDDLVTTGATLAEVSRVLTGAGAAPSHAAVVAATVKRFAHIGSAVADAD
ncbi:ComF family protein [Fodinicola feengrottensis]|uniref:ComF family protein n=1 Tax=Fodinicola feengrottensis TaxID=435914 RepID=UPI002442453D|nr:phosphoribosyltransferase family protein [Fodinicola feengrottensis]